MATDNAVSTAIGVRADCGRKPTGGAGVRISRFESAVETVGRFNCSAGVRLYYDGDDE
jgi:hypothetical protein